MPEYTPIIETLLERMEKLEVEVKELQQHQHQYRPTHALENGSMPHTTRPTGMGSKR